MDEEVGKLDELAIYQRARTRARRTPTFRLRRQVRHLAVRARQRRLGAVEAARLAAVRTELRIRGLGDARHRPFRGIRGPVRRPRTGAA